MTAFSTIFKTGVAAALLVAGVTTGVQGQMSRGVLHIKGNVLCAGCSLDELRRTQPNQEQLYQFTHERGQLVMRVRSVNDYPTWRSFGWPAELAVRAQDKVFQQLTVEGNLFKDVEIAGALSTTKTLDIFAVTIHG